MSSPGSSSFEFTSDGEEFIAVQEEERPKKKRKKKRVVGRRKRYRSTSSPLPSDEHEEITAGICKQVFVSSNIASPPTPQQRLLFQQDGMSSPSSSSFEFTSDSDEYIAEQEEERSKKKQKKKRVVGRGMHHRPLPSSDERDDTSPDISKRVHGPYHIPSPPTHQQQLLFQNDTTGRKPIRPSALRFSMKVVEQEATQTTKAIAASLLESGQEEESRKVLVHASEHASKIVERVRETLRQVKMPARYVRIVDVSLESIDATNKKRANDIEDVKNQLARLTKKKKVFEAEYQKAKSKCDELKAKFGRKRETPVISGMEVHPLLKDFVSSNEGTINPNDATAVAQLDENRPLVVKRPDDESKFVSALLEQISSIYD